MLPDPRIAQTVLFGSVGLLAALALGFTLRRAPLLQWRTRDPEWLRAWLVMTVADYYGAALALCAVVVADVGVADVGVGEGLAWSAAFCVLGAPACCAYAVRRAWR